MSSDNELKKLRAAMAKIEKRKPLKKIANVKRGGAEEEIRDDDITEVGEVNEFVEPGDEGEQRIDSDYARLDEAYSDKNKTNLMLRKLIKHVNDQNKMGRPMMMLRGGELKELGDYTLLLVPKEHREEKMEKILEIVDELEGGKNLSKKTGKPKRKISGGQLKWQEFVRQTAAMPENIGKPRKDILKIAADLYHHV